MQKIIAFAFALLYFQQANAQQEMGLAFLTHLPQAPLQVNPATFSDYRLNLVLPNFYAGYQNSAFNLGSLFVNSPEGGRKLDLSTALAGLSPTGNVLRSSVALNSAALSFRLKSKFQISFFHNTQVDFQFIYPKALPEMLWRGNGAFLGQALEIGPSLNLLAWHEYGTGLSIKLHEKFTAGVNVKYLSGMAGLRTINSQLSMLTSEDFYQLSLRSDMTLRTGGLSDVFNDSEADVIPSTDPAYLLNSGNSGIGVDIGMSIRPTPRLTIDLAMQDVGKIYWSKYALEQVSKGSFQYAGEVVRPFAEEDSEFDFNSVLDSISNLVDFKATAKPFYTELPQRFSFVGRYELNSGLLCGASFHYEFWNGISNLAGAAHLQMQVGHLFCAGVMAAYHQQFSLMLGANVILQLGPLQFFAITDNLLTILDPTIGQATNIRVGLNLALLRKKSTRSEGAKAPNERYYFKGKD